MSSIQQLSCQVGDLRREAGTIEDEIADLDARIEAAPNRETVEALREARSEHRGTAKYLRRQIADVEQQAARQGGHIGSSSPLASTQYAGPLGSGNASPDLGGGHQETGRPPLMFRDLSSGAKMRALEPRERLCQERPPISIGDYLVGRLRGGDYTFLDKPGEEFAARIAQQEGSIAGGGAMVIPTLSSLFLDLAREQSKVIAAGCRTLPMDTGQLVIGRLDSDPSPSFVGEGGAVTASQGSYGALSVTPRKLVTLTFCTREWLQDCPNASDLVQRSHTGAAGAKLDHVALYGQTGAEPLGLKHSSLNEVASVGTPSNFDEVSQAVREIMDANYPGEVSSLSWLLSPREGQTYNDLKDTTNQPLQAPEWVQKLKRFYATAIDVDEGVGGDEATSFVGDFSELCLFVRQPLSFEFLASGTALDADGNTENALSEDKIAIRSTMRVAVVTLRPSFFVKMTGVTSA